MKKRYKDLIGALFVSGIIFLLLYPFIAFAEWEWGIDRWHWWSRTIIAVSAALSFFYIFASDDN